MTEQEIADKIMLAYPKMDKLRKAPDQFSSFDYENDRYLLEFKSRRVFYNPWIIEQLKLDTNINIAESVKKDFLYVTESLGTIYVWNISKLIKDGYDFEFDMRECPKCTEIPGKRNDEMILKTVGYLYISASTKIDFRGKQYE
tara:strand:- start:937 stop:1365 length:429 start_codon:yes stop_codon:yes gene_type:complete